MRKTVTTRTERGQVLSSMICVLALSVWLVDSKGADQVLSTEYVQVGDIQLGVMVAMSTSFPDCVLVKTSFLLGQTLYAIRFAVERINRDPNLLPGIVLGFTAVDTCFSEEMAVAQALRFRAPSLSHDNRTDDDDGFDVVGVISGMPSGSTIFTSYVLSANHIPQMSYSATSHDLASPDYFWYFLRMADDNYVHMKAIVEFMASQGWSYFSAVYLDQPFGHAAMEAVRLAMMSHFMCIHKSFKVALNASVASFQKIVRELVQNSSASRVVLFVGYGPMVHNLLKAIREAKAEKKLIWINVAEWTQAMLGAERSLITSALGSFTLNVYSQNLNDFKEYITSLDPLQAADPWYQKLWEARYKCLFSHGTCHTHIGGSKMKKKPRIHLSSVNALAIDSVYAYAHALDQLRKDKCATLSGRAAAGCIKDFAQGVKKNNCTMLKADGQCEKFMLPYLRSISFPGRTGPIHFDDMGEQLRDVTIHQVLPSPSDHVSLVQVAVYVSEWHLVKQVSPISWDYVATHQATPGLKASSPETPTSRCGRPCGKREIKQMGVNRCCWQCIPCRGDEILDSSLDECYPCPKFHWPDESTNFTTCMALAHTFHPLDNPVMVILLIFPSIGIPVTTGTIVLYIIHRNNRIIKASSRELSAVQLVSIFVGLAKNYLIIILPTPALCTVIFFFSFISYTGLYGPLLLKTVRIYRLFNAALEGRRNVSFVKPFQQLLFTAVLIAIQVVLCSVLASKEEIVPKLLQKSSKSVIIYCAASMKSIAMFLAYDLLILFLCSYFAYKCRRLPDNFNESHFIHLCVLSTLVTWLASVPIIFAISNDHWRQLVVSCTLSINLLVALVFLFLNRLYLVLFVKSLGDTAGRSMSDKVTKSKSSWLSTPDSSKHQQNSSI